MSSILQDLMGQLGGSQLDGLSKQLGADRKQAQAGVAMALPMLLGALSRNAQGGQGAQALASALDRDHDGSILNDVAGFLGRGDTSPGAGILKHAFGGRQTRMQNGLSQSTGMSADATGKLLMLLAPMVLGALGKAKRQGGLDAAGLASMLGGEQRAAATAGGPQMGAINLLLDTDGDGDVDLNDLMKSGGGILGKLFG